MKFGYMNRVDLAGWLADYSQCLNYYYYCGKMHMAHFGEGRTCVHVYGRPQEIIISIKRSCRWRVMSEWITRSEMWLHGSV